MDVYVLSRSDKIVVLYLESEMTAAEETNDILISRLVPGQACCLESVE